MRFWKCLYKLFMRKTLNSIVITVAKISLKSSIWKYVYKLFMNYKLVQLYENEKFNCDQCGKYFARRCNLKVLIQNVHENSWIELWTLANISPKHSICGKSFTKSQRNYDCDSCRKLSTQLENLNKHIMGIHARQRNYKCISCGKYITKSASLMIHIKIINQGQRNHNCDYCGKFYTQMTNLKIHFKMFHEE